MLIANKRFDPFVSHTAAFYPNVKWDLLFAETMLYGTEMST